MPVESIAPSPPVVWRTELSYPNNNQSNQIGTVIVGNPAILAPTSLISGGSAARTYDYGSEGGGATSEVSAVYREKPCARARVNGGSSQGRGTGWMSPFWQPSFAAAGGWAPGAREADPAGVVGVFDWNWALSTNDPADVRQDSAGFSFQPGENMRLGRIISGTRLGANPAGGFGVFFNDDGAGNFIPEWVVWDAAGATVNRVALADPSVVPDYTLWNWLRIIIVGAAGGRDATVEAYVNGSQLVGPQVFGTDVDGPNTMDATAMQFGFASTLFGNAPGPNKDLYYTLYHRAGRFRPNGVPIQGQ